MFDYKPVNKNIFINNVYDEAAEKRYALFNRYLQPARLSFNDCVLIVDDDVIPNREVILKTHESWEKNKFNCHGPRGRVCLQSPAFSYSYKDCHVDRAPILLTSFLMTSIKVIQMCVNEEPNAYDKVKNYKPKWNGEDIFLSLLAMKLTQKKNFIINNIKNKMIIYKRDAVAISAGEDHIKCRTEFCLYLCKLYDIDYRNLF
jgi:hypothetical protein